MAEDLDHIWKALSDPTRREILDRLREGPCTTNDLVERFPNLSRFGVMKHLEVLRQAGLVHTRAEGRLRINTINVAPIRQIVERWISKYDALWTNTLLRVKESTESTSRGRTRKKGKDSDPG